MQCHSGATALHSPWNMLRVGEQVMKNPSPARLLGSSAEPDTGSILDAVRAWWVSLPYDRYASNGAS